MYSVSNGRVRDAFSATLCHVRRKGTMPGTSNPKFCFNTLYLHSSWLLEYVRSEHKPDTDLHTADMSK